jgi:hypothetical protein
MFAFAEAELSDPWLKFYPTDWRADPALRMCTIAARGLWMEMLCIMHEAEPRGSLLINGNRVMDRQLASLCGCSEREIKTLVAELEVAGVFSRDNGVIYSRRMRGDTEQAAKDKANGKRGGNPGIKRGVNPPDKGRDKAHIPEARDQSSVTKVTAGKPAPVDPQAELFERAKAVLGQDAGGLIAKLLKAKNGIVPHARAVIEQASTKQDPREYVGRVIRGRDDTPQEVGFTRMAI